MARRAPVNHVSGAQGQGIGAPQQAGRARWACEEWASVCCHGVSVASTASLCFVARQSAHPTVKRRWGELTHGPRYLLSARCSVLSAQCSVLHLSNSLELQAPASSSMVPQPPGSQRMHTMSPEECGCAMVTGPALSTHSVHLASACASRAVLLPC